ncbi:uncharacterized protein LOC101784465 [Setaria italica]|uniref:uncharacterized protein LOC101757864 n=1 Tax=Setaria italica TaxID=4555 RepID=UPI000350E3C2|nr:uncharacterized protein LOC101757864 [Setaria italica]XP_014660786.1 uncharacterized protein LOC101784465 [Setaria italica]
MVRAHLYVAFPGHRRASSTGRHARWRCPSCSVRVAVGSSSVCVAVGSSSRGLAWACRMGPDCLGTLLRHHGPDSSSRSGLDRRLGCHFPYYTRPWMWLPGDLFSAVTAPGPFTPSDFLRPLLPLRPPLLQPLLLPQLLPLHGTGVLVILAVLS